MNNTKRFFPHSCGVMLKGKNRLKLLENVNLEFAACFIGSEINAEDRRILKEITSAIIN